jgi:hypothetical protein
VSAGDARTPAGGHPDRVMREVQAGRSSGSRPSPSAAAVEALGLATAVRIIMPGEAASLPAAAA